uniref:Uncharacterized protein n=1 Tax=Rhizophora mucronata TaxID=61149 RepID=A0A2P2QA02_RHIMU
MSSLQILRGKAWKSCIGNQYFKPCLKIPVSFAVVMALCYAFYDLTFTLFTV